MKTRLPILLSIPHGGTKVPRDAKHSFLLNRKHRIADGDAYTFKLYQFKDFEVVRFPYARAFLDLNRHQDDLPPNNPDGIFKTHTIFNAPVWKSFPDATHQLAWLNTYYTPYFETLFNLMQSKLLGIDCHSMLAHDPFDNHKPARPLLCISNGGNSGLDDFAQDITAPIEIIHNFKSILESHFGENTVLINDPFQGGHIIRTMHEKTKKPWIQLEINRSLYMQSDFPARLDSKRLKMLKGTLHKSLLTLSESIK